jgi:hypothetical protein
MSTVGAAAYGACASKYEHLHTCIKLQAWTGREGSRRLRLPDFNTIGTVRLSALATGRLYLPGNIPGTHFC